MSKLQARPRTHYLDWKDGEHNFAHGVALAKELARAHGTSLTVIRADKNHLPSELKGIHVVTPRSGGPAIGSFVAAFYPDIRMMSRFFHPETNFLVVDHAQNKMRAWAELNTAMDLRTQTQLNDQRPAEVIRIHELISHHSYNGFTSPPASYTLSSNLRELHSLGWLDERGKDYLVASQLFEHTDGTLTDLRKAADKINPTPARTRSR